MIYFKDSVEQRDYERNPEEAVEIAIEAGYERAYSHDKIQDKIRKGLVCGRYGDFLGVSNFYTNPEIISFGDDPETVLKQAFSKGLNEVYLVPNFMPEEVEAFSHFTWGGQEISIDEIVDQLHGKFAW